MRIFTAAVLAAGLGLSACIDVDINTEILGADQARVSGYTQVRQDMLDMMGGQESFCPTEEGGTVELIGEHARCNMLIEGDFATVFEAEEGAAAPTAEDLGDGTVRVLFPIAAATADAAEMRQDPQMAAMMRPMLEGHNFTLRISGAEIVSTNGERSDDGRSAVFTFPLVQILDENAELPENFEAVVRY